MEYKKGEWSEEEFMKERHKMSENIVFLAPAGSGKDEAGVHLIRFYGYTRYAFADSVKELAAKYFPERYDNKQKDRALLQDIGTKMREIDSEVWIRAMFRKVDNVKAIREKCYHSEENIVVTDCRMPNEYEALKKRGFTFIRIAVDEDIRNQRMKERGDNFTHKDLKHHTETFYDSFECEYEISNNGSLEELKYELDRVMDKLLTKGA